ncbi:MAG: hypothetical protein MRJ96_10565 [Nitrospirales bacterium]|nr:hypothetical protein [Nitrospirales bacterium]
MLTQKLPDIVKTAANRELALIPFKGPTLAVMAYENLLLRVFGIWISSLRNNATGCTRGL